jgi:hypothetical protein
MVNLLIASEVDNLNWLKGVEPALTVGSGFAISEEAKN